MVTYEPSTSPKRPGTTARFRCNENYALVGNPTRVCQQNLTWSGSEPECKGELVLMSQLYGMLSLHVAGHMP